MDLEDVIKTLRKCELFSDLSATELRAIAKSGSVEEYQPGDTIYKQGDLGTNLYVLSKGQVSLHRKLMIGPTRTADATVYVLRETPRRRLMGGWYTLVGEQHIQMCSARCDKPTKVVSIDCSVLREVIVKNPGIRMKILEKLVLILRDRMESSYTAMETL